MKKINLLLTAIFIAVATLVSCGGNNNGKREAQSLSGAGATFPLPFYNAVFEQYSSVSGDEVAYGGIGSGGGVRNLKDKIVDFAGSDAFLSDKEMSEMDSIIHIPTCMGAVVLAYNIDNVSNLNLTGELIADIYSGKITMWNDSRIAEINPGTKLPAERIVPVFRSDGSGTTFVFTDYLTKVSEKWAAEYGCGKSVNFPAGQAAKGNPGVAGVINQTKNSIGYVGSEYAFAQKIAYANIQNACGEFVIPTSESISAAASGEIPADTRTSITNSDAKGAYPISTFTWILLYKNQDYSDRSKEQAAATIELVKYILSDDAQKMTSAVHYAPLPAKAIELSLKNLKTITYGNEPVLK